MSQRTEFENGKLTQADFCDFKPLCIERARFDCERHKGERLCNRHAWPTHRPDTLYAYSECPASKIQGLPQAEAHIIGFEGAGPAAYGLNERL